MRNWTVVDWVLFMLGAAVAIDLIICIGLPVVLGIPTTAENKETREKLIQMLNNISIAIIALIVYKMKEMNDNKKL